MSPAVELARWRTLVGALDARMQERAQLDDQVVLARRLHVDRKLRDLGYTVPRRRWTIEQLRRATATATLALTPTEIIRQHFANLITAGVIDSAGRRVARDSIGRTWYRDPDGARWYRVERGRRVYDED